MHLRNDCRLAAQTLSKGHPAPKTDWALSIIFRCDESAGPALQALWATPPSDSVALEQLVEASARMLDHRVYLSASTIASSSGNAQSARIGALRVLASFVDAEFYYYPVQLLRPSADSTHGVAYSHGISQVVGAQPITSADVLSIRILIKTLALSDPNPVIRFAAGRFRSPGY